jgi:diguanylate cyclase (GGDEF)-like protein/PAS domain S-box-containing protein
LNPAVRKAGAILFWGALLACGALGLFRPIDDLLRDMRFGAASRAASGDIVFVEIDSRSLAQVGVWPWPRQVHAQLLDTLMSAGADEAIFDIDFSSQSSAEGDAAFERALADAGGYAFLAAFQQRSGAEGALTYNLPLDRFRTYASPVAVNVTLDPAGVVRIAPYGITLDGLPVPAAAAELAGVRGPIDAGFAVDFSIDPRSVDRISAADLLTGKVDPARIAGKKIVIGASAIELRDFFVVPRHGVLPGGLLQILAAETLKQGRALGQLPWLPLLLALLATVLSLAFGRRLNLVATVAGGLAAAVGLEIAALVLQVGWALLLDTALVQISLGVVVLQTLIVEMQRRGRMHRKAARERDTTRRILDRVVEDNFDGVVVVEQSGRIVAASRIAEQFLGEGLAGGSVAGILRAPLADEFDTLLSDPSALPHTAPREFVLASRDGSERVVEYVIRRSMVEIEGGLSRVVCLTFRDITERRRAEDRLRYLGSHDPLTGALSRPALVDRVADLCAKRASFAVIAVDLRRFRAINDSLGHGSGDELLKQVVSRLRNMGPDVVARLGGDSFVLLSPEVDPVQLKGFCEAVAEFLSFPYELDGGHQAVIAVSAGATISLVTGYDPDELLSHADMALSAAKQIAGNGVALFAPDMDRRLRERRAMDAALRHAIPRGQFSLAYQPQVDLQSGATTGVEALLRWQHPELGWVGPDKFIPVAEETGIILQIGRWALDEACRAARSWPGIDVAVNASPVQFELSDVATDAIAALERAGLPADRLTIEITEGIFVGHSPRVIDQLERLRARGVRIALDDFGTGYSSMSYLGRLPLDKIKIDQSFVRRLPSDQEAIAIIRSVTELGHALGKDIVAEGVETADQAWLLKMMGCQVGQGYHFARPLPASGITALLTPETALAIPA